MPRQKIHYFEAQMLHRSILRQSQQLFVCTVIITVLLVLFYEIHYGGKGTELQPPRMVQQITQNRITVTFWGRNGNHMFEYATLLGTATRNNMTPVLVENTGIRNCFKLKMNFTSVRSLGVLKYYHERLAGAYKPEFEKLEPFDAYLQGYLQSWKYFENVRKELLKNHFVFHDHIWKEAQEFIRRARREHKKKNAVLVAIHIRRGDFVRQKRKGYGAAPVPFLYRAMNYYRKKYKNVLFIVCSNDIIWSQDVLDAKYYNIQYSFIKDGFVDLAVLASCDHAIITVGSYSWWAGYLTGGEVVYHKGFPEPNTTMGDRYVREDYYPSWWIPM